MAKKVEDTVLEYFQEAPLQTAELMLHLVTKTVSERQPLVGTRTPKKRAARKVETADLKHSGSLSFPGEAKAAD